MILSQEIARLLEEMLESGGGELSIVRNELAQSLGCVPSQINYVLTSRFTPERGYLVESRRGGGGYIRIRKVSMNPREELLGFYHAIASEVDFETCRIYLSDLVARGYFREREGRLLLAALSDNALLFTTRAARGAARAQIFKTVLLQYLSEREEK